MDNNPNQPPYGQPQQPYGPPPQQPYGQPAYGPPGYPPPGYTQPAPPKKRSLRWLWITLGIVGGLCVICSVAVYFGLPFLFKQAGPRLTVEAYYQAIEKQDYVTASALLAPNATASAPGQGAISISGPGVFVKAGQQLDKVLGTVTQHRIETSGDTTVVSVLVTRSSGQKTRETLTLVQIGNDWKIQNISILPA